MALMVRPPEAGCGAAPKLSDNVSPGCVAGVTCGLEPLSSERELLPPLEGKGARACSRARKTSPSSDAAFFGSRARSSICFHARMYGCELGVVTERIRVAAERRSYGFARLSASARSA